jgi:hypothetical protein
MITLQNPNDNIKYFLNANSTVLYTYNIEQQTVKLDYSSDFETMDLPIIKKGVNKFMSLEEIIKEDNDFIRKVKIIASTTKQEGYFAEFDMDTGITTNCLNIYLNSIIFQNALTDNHYSITCEENLIELLESEAPTTYRLLKNLFHNESDEVLINFLNYLNVISFTDNKQDVMFLFKGTTPDKEGQGAGKGVLRDLLLMIFSGLVCSVSNESYKEKFNAELLNKKVVIFDELDLKALRYSKLKDITGSGTLRIENKNKDALVVPNVSSWLLFTNENDLRDTIGANDRRTFIIQPSPINDSLRRDVIDIYYDGDFSHFKASLFGEIENFIHIISLASGKVRTPLELRTEAHKNYFSDSRYRLTDINQFNDIFLNKNSKRKFIEFLEELKTLNEISVNEFERMKYYLNIGFYYQDMLQEVFTLCQKYKIGNIRNGDTIRVAIKALKDELIKQDHELFNLDTSFTYKSERHRVKHNGCIRVKDTNKEAQKEINKQIKSFYIQNLAA